MSKNIVLLCDGTSNQITRNRSNIVRLFGCLEKGDAQTVFYDPGVGTFGAENSASHYHRKAVEVWGLATGWGIHQNVKEAYEFLVHHYHHGDKKAGIAPDKIYIFGFSRGAYTARLLAGFIHAVGLIHPDHLNLLDYAYRAYSTIGDDPGEEKDGGVFDKVRLFERMLRPIRPVISFMGLFDTVGSVFESSKLGPRLKTHAFTNINPSVARVSHAVALDERRTMFLPQLWPHDQIHRPKYFAKSSEIAQIVNEQWFKGVHGDIGGGYPEEDSALAKIPLHWMIQEAKSAGLSFKTQTVNRIVLGKSNDDYVAPDPKVAAQNSMNSLWPILEYLPRKNRRPLQTSRPTFFDYYIPRCERRILPPDAVLHESVRALDS